MPPIPVPPIPSGPPGSVFVWGNWQYGLDLGETINEGCFVLARLSALSDGSYQHLGPTLAARNQMLATIVNRSILAMMEKLSVVGQAVETMPVSPGQNLYDIPAAMLGRQITAIYYSLLPINGTQAGALLTFIQQGAFANFDPALINGTTRVPWPWAWNYTVNCAAIALWPWPAGSLSIDVFYQQAPGEITATMISQRDTSPTLIGEVPTLWRDALAAKIGAEVIQSLDAGIAASLDALWQARVLECQKSLTKVQAATVPQTQGMGALNGPIQWRAAIRGAGPGFGYY